MCVCVCVCTMLLPSGNILVQGPSYILELHTSIIKGSNLPLLAAGTVTE